MIPNNMSMVGAEEGDNLPLLDGEIDVVDGRQVSSLGREGLDEILDDHRCFVHASMTPHQAWFRPWSGVTTSP